MNDEIDLRELNAAWIAIGVDMLVLAMLFNAEIIAAVRVWYQSTAYGHCFLVLPIVAWLAWERRDVLAAITARPILWPCLLALPLAAFWLAADWLGIMEGRQLAALGFTEILLLAAFGWRLWWALSPALLYLAFLVPFGDFLTPSLQTFTTAFIVDGLHILNIPVDADAFRINIPEGSFYVAEACAGLRFLIAAIAFGVLYAVTMFRSPVRRAIFIAISCVVPVIANGFRGLGIVVLGHILGSAQAGAADHLIYGWIFFSIVILSLAAAGLPFRQAAASRLPALQPPEPLPGAALHLLSMCVPILFIAAAGPVLARIQASGTHAAPILPKLVAPQGCTPTGQGAAGAVTAQYFKCSDQTVRVVVNVLPRATNPASIIAAARAPATLPLGGEIDQETTRIDGPTPTLWQTSTDRDTGATAAYTIWVGGQQALSGLRDRLRMARAMFSGAPAHPIAIAVTILPGAPAAKTLLRGFLAAQTTLPAQIAAAQ